MSAGNLVNIPRLPDEKQLAGEENWRPFKREILFAVQLRGLTGYMDGTIPKPTPRTQDYPGPIYPTMATPPYSPTPHPEEWELRDRLVGGAIVSNIVDPIGLGVDEMKRASEIWQNLIKRFEKRDEQQIHLAETGLRREVFDPSTDTMESHEKKMRNLLKRVHDLGGTTTDAQFRRIVIFSMPPEWRQDVRTVPGNSSANAFTYLQTLWYQREEERKEEERDTKRVKVLMAAHSQLPTFSQPRDQNKGGTRPTVICHNCSKPGHIAKKCWAKGGGMEGQGPKGNYRSKDNPTANAIPTNENETNSPMATYVMSAQSNVGTNTNKIIPF
ncbi:hypothetical protein EV359DRAFT_82495 [Lentinula novae-zelandiae]|nr:hypothetical protein EV359DRAFT_82495 [Lentinula novae-zelandiae]